MRGYAVIAILILSPALCAGGQQTHLGRPRRTDPRPDRRVRHRESPAAALQQAAGVRRQRRVRQEAVDRRSRRESGPAARNGDLVQVTKIDIGDDKLVLQINGGFKGGRKWYQGVQIGMGGSRPRRSPRTTIPTRPAEPRSRFCSTSRSSP